MVRRGSRASSAKGAAASNPMKARTVKTEAANTPENPLKPGLFANFVVNTDSVLWSARAIRNSARATNTPISNNPSTVPVRADTRIPRYPRKNTIAAPTRTHGHHRSAARCGGSRWKKSAAANPRFRYSSGATSGSMNAYVHAIRNPMAGCRPFDAYV